MLLKHALETAPRLMPLELLVDTVTTAEVMLSLFEKGQWDYELVVVDEILTGAGGKLRGSEGVRELKKERECASKFIMSSANCSADDRARYKETGAVAVWPKPYPPIAEMATNIRSILEIQESPRSRNILIVEDDQMNAMILKQ